MTKHIHIRKQLDELERVFDVWDTTNRDLTDEEQRIIDNFSRNFAEAIIAEICPQWSKEIAEDILKWHEAIIAEICPQWSKEIAEDILKWHTENKDTLDFCMNT